MVRVYHGTVLRRIVKRVHWLLLALGGAIGLYALSRTRKGGEVISNIIGGGVTKLLDFVSREEGEVLTAYPDAGGKWTIGVGHLITGTERVAGERLHPYGPITRITQEQSRAFLADDIKIASRGVDDAVAVLLTTNQRDALISLVFNIGVGAFTRGGPNGGPSTLLAKVNKADFAGAANEFGKWVNVGGVRNPGLVKRRERERQLFLGVSA
jgi:lysozyme